MDDDKKLPEIAFGPPSAGEEKKLPSIEEEFAELNAELQRIAALPLATPEQSNALLVTLESLRENWNKKGLARGDTVPTWRKVVDAAVTIGFDGIIRDLQMEGMSSPGGTLRLDPNMLKRHLEPVFYALTDGLRQNLVEKLGKKPAPGAPPIKLDGADVAGILLMLFGPQPKKK